MTADTFMDVWFYAAAAFVVLGNIGVGVYYEAHPSDDEWQRETGHVLATIVGAAWFTVPVMAIGWALFAWLPRAIVKASKR